MYIAAFIYKPGERDDEFQRLTDLIDALAARLPGYVGAAFDQRQLLLA